MIGIEIEFLKKLFYKYKTLGDPARAAIWFAICSILVKAISFITAPIFTRLLSDYEYGCLTLIITYEQIIMILATWEMHLGAFQKGIFKYKDDIKGFATALIALINVITLIVFFFIFLFRDIIVDETGMTNFVLVILLPYCLVVPAYNIWLINERTKYHYKNVVLVTIVYSLLNVISQIFAVIFIGRTAEIKYSAGVIVSIIYCLFFYVKYLNYGRLFKDIKKALNYWKYMITYQAPLVIHSLSFLILNQIDRIMIGKMVGNAQAAYYGVAYSIASIISIITNSINQSLLPWRYEQLEAENYKKINNNTNKLLVFLAAIILLVIIIFPEVIKILFTRNYFEAIWCMPPIAISIYFIFLYSIFVNVETYYEKTIYVTVVSVLCGGLNILLNYFFINKYGYLACGYTTLLSYILFALGHYYFMNKVLESNDIEKIFDGRMIVIISFILLLTMIVTTYLYKYIIVRYSILVCLLFVGVIKRYYVKEFLNNILGKDK